MQTSQCLTLLVDFGFLNALFSADRYLYSVHSYVFIQMQHI